MDYSLAVAITCGEVSRYLPHDIMLFILSKLPIKSLKRILCVCKSWSLLFKIPYFMNMYCNNIIHDNRSCYDDTFFVLHKRPMPDDYGYHSEFYWLYAERIENRVKLNWPHPFQEDDTDIFVVGSVSVNGIFCLKQGFSCTRQVVLWNPTTRESKVIPSSSIENIPPDRNPWFILHGFGYDHVSDDYKVTQMIDFFLVIMTMKAQI
jgi:hypothetical protein